MRKWFLVLVLVLAATVPPLSASTFRAMSTGELVRDSSAIVEGEVLKVQSYWNAAGSVIVTEALVLVDGVLVGDAPSVVRVKTFGGTVNGYTIEASGFPTFQKGERLVLFLQADAEPDMMRITGYQQGQYRIARDPRGIEKAVSALDEGANLLGPNGRPVAYPKALALDDLRQQIKAEAARQAGGPLAN